MIFNNESDRQTFASAHKKQSIETTVLSPIGVHEAFNDLYVLPTQHVIYVEDLAVVDEAYALKAIEQLIRLARKDESISVFYSAFSHQSSLSNKIRQQVDASGLPDERFKLIGQSEDNWTDFLLKKADVVINLSQQQTFSHLLLKAAGQKKLFS